MSNITNSARFRVACLTVFVLGAFATPSFAAADPATGIDWAVLGGDVLDSAKPAIIAGLAIMAVVLAVTLGRKLFSKVAK